MAQLSTKVKTYVEAAGKTVDFTSNVSLQDDGNGSYIKEWNINGLAKPTEEQLNALEAQANTLEASNQVIANRKAEYPSIADQLDEIYHNGIDSWKSMIKVTKDKYPK